MYDDVGILWDRFLDEIVEEEYASDTVEEDEDNYTEEWDK